MPRRFSTNALLLVWLLALVACGSGPEEAADSGDWGESHGRLQALGERHTDDPAEIEFALDRLEHGSATERVVAAWALGAIRHKEAEPALRATLDDADKNVRSNAIGALFALAPTDWPDIAARGLSDEDVFVQQSTLSKMPDLTPPQLVAPIGELLATSEDETVRVGAADALGKANGGDAVVRVLAVAVSDASKDVRSHVAFALGKAGNANAVAALATLLEDEAWEVRANACQALGGYRTPEAIELINRALEDPNGQVRAVAARVAQR